MLECTTTCTMWAAMDPVQAICISNAQLTSVPGMPKQGDHVRSTAVKRPSAYIHRELGIPVPFGAFSPFKPSTSVHMQQQMRQRNH